MSGGGMIAFKDEIEAAEELLHKVVKNIQYKPGVTINVRCDTYHPQVIIDMKVMDSDNLERTIELHYMETISSYWYRLNESEMIDILYGVILNMEKHEASEFFRYKNKKVFNPHKNESIMELQNV